MFNNKVLLITGGTGSFGETVVKHFLNTDIAEIRIFSRDEKKQEEMRIQYNDEKLKFVIGDVRDYDSILSALFEVDYVFHAAALKQVPSCEFHPIEAVKTNVLGTQNVVKAASASRVKKVVVLSTDKAVYPINAMGISKAMAEKIVSAYSHFSSKNNTIICSTRYGNVMASRGSVIPLFINQIKAKKRLTLTDPNMTRFLMSLDESVELVMYAFKHAQQGDLFVQKSPAATLENLAKALSELFGVDYNPQIIGTRHGEKLYETLISREEMARAEVLGEYYRIPSDSRDLNYAKYFREGQTKVTELPDYTSHNTQQLDISKIKSLLNSLDYVKEQYNA